MLKKMIIAILIASSPAVASAGIMADMNSMFMSNATGPTNLTNKDRTGVFGGSFYMRTPIHAVNIVSFDPPRLDAGCGGVDLYGGSFTFISTSALVALFRNIASNAAGLAFKAAIDAMVPSLGKLMTEFQTLLQRMNNLAKNSCAMAHLIIDEGEKIIGSATSGDAQTSTVQHGLVSDWASSLAEYNKDPTKFINQASHLNPHAGNSNMKALVNTGAAAILGTVGIPNIGNVADDSTNPNDLNNRVIISLIGYDIKGISCIKSNAAGTTTAVTPPVNGTTAPEPLTNMECSGPPTIDLSKLIEGGDAGSNSPDSNFLLYECLDPNGTVVSQSIDNQICTSMKKTDYPYPGIRAYVNNMLIGQPNTKIAGNPQPGSILGDYQVGQSYTVSPTQTAFIRQTGVPIIGLLGKTSDPNEQMHIAIKLSDYITSCIAGRVGEALYKATLGIKDSNGLILSHDLDANQKQLRDDYMNQQKVCEAREALVKLQEELVHATQLNAR
jgi:conjugative transfer pilus assembly protein TraH